MAKLREEGNLPYTRTHKLSKGWKADVVLTDAGGTFSISNAAPETVYVQGDLAQPFHLDTGWPQAAPIITKYAALLEDVLIDSWFTIIDGV